MILDTLKSSGHHISQPKGCHCYVTAQSNWLNRVSDPVLACYWYSTVDEWWHACLVVSLLQASSQGITVRGCIPVACTNGGKFPSYPAIQTSHSTLSVNRVSIKTSRPLRTGLCVPIASHYQLVSPTLILIKVISLTGMGEIRSTNTVETRVQKPISRGCVTLLARV